MKLVWYGFNLAAAFTNVPKDRDRSLAISESCCIELFVLSLIHGTALAGQKCRDLWHNVLFYIYTVFQLIKNRNYIEHINFVLNLTLKSSHWLVQSVYPTVVCNDYPEQFSWGARCCHTHCTQGTAPAGDNMSLARAKLQCLTLVQRPRLTFASWKTWWVFQMMKSS